MRCLIIGAGEVGTSLFNALSPFHEMQIRDLEDKRIKGPIELLTICIRYTPNFVNIVKHYQELYKPIITEICTTVPPGTTEQLENAVHSTTRGLHPNLTESIKTFVKHIGGPRAAELARYYAEADIKTACHATSRTTELAHILSNAVYGVNLILADELNAICRKYGVDYQQAVLEYNKTSNDGYRLLGHDSKLRMLLNPPGGKIGGHCVVQGPRLIPEENRGRLLSLLSNYNGDA